MSSTDERFTPDWILDLVREVDFINLDPCTVPGNPTRACMVRCLGMVNDGLGQWPMGWNSGLAFVNWPFSRGQSMKWANKCIEEARNGWQIIALSRADVRTKWFGRLRRNANAVCLLERGVGFVMPDGRQLPGDFYGTALWYWGCRPDVFRHVFDAHGWVLDLPGPQEA